MQHVADSSCCNSVLKPFPNCKNLCAFFLSKPKFYIRKNHLHSFDVNCTDCVLYCSVQNRNTFVWGCIFHSNDAQVDLFQQDKVGVVENTFLYHLMHCLVFLNILLSNRKQFLYFESFTTLLFVDKISIRMFEEFAHSSFLVFVMHSVRWHEWQI